MRRCLACEFLFTGPGWMCPRCEWRPALCEGREHFAAQISGADESYDPAWYAELARLEEGNFWFMARNRMIAWMAHRHLPAQADFLELGCGTGFVLKRLKAEFPGWRITAAESHAEGLGFASARAGPGVVFQQLDARALPYRDALDIVGAFDVIEHIREDAAVLGEIHAALRPRGWFFASVPQHMFLWSKNDEASHHFRRYSMAELAQKLDAAGFGIVETTSFNSLLLPLLVASRMLKARRGEVDVLDELRLGAAANAALSAILGIEFALTRIGVRWPFGGSRLVLARKLA